LLALAQVPPITAPKLQSLGLAGDRALVIVDVDEVLGLFMRGFGEFVSAQGFEMRVERFALLQSLFRPGEQEHVAPDEGRRLFDEFFRVGCGDMEPAPGAVEALTRLARRAEIIILSNAPVQAQRPRTDWLMRHGLPYPLILSSGPKGPITAGLTAQARGPSAFVDDLIPNLDSVAEHSPATTTFQHVADERLRPLAPARPELHRRIDDWQELGAAIEAAIAE